ncbi:MAG: sulfatase-like hydrolase/transferase [Actinobacteria bacterium]|nr:sulfatase-like hydrolase/transferase [Actinomycetota bacterium]
MYHGSLKSRWTEYVYTKFYASGGGTDMSSSAANFDPNWLSPYDQQPIGNGTRYQKWMIDFGPSGKDAMDDPDGVSAEWVRQRLSRDHARPFFIGWGITAAHVPWRVPQRFFDLHPLDQVVVPDLRPQDLDDLGPMAKATINMTDFERLQKSGQWPAAVRAYQAAQSFADDRVGMVLNELRNSKYADNTIVVVWSDNAFHLGEKMHVHKYTLWERATRVPLLLHVPKRFATATTFDPPVSLIDLAPTLADLCGYRLIRQQSGTSLLPLIDRPELAGERPPIMTRDAGNHSVRRGPWRYTRYRTGEAELYDHRSDPEEYDNLASRPEHRQTIDELARFLPSVDVISSGADTRGSGKAAPDAGGG